MKNFSNNVKKQLKFEFIFFFKMQEETKYYKVLNAELTHHGFKYQLGLNIDTKLFNQEECENGLYFCSKDQLATWINYGENLAVVRIPQDARVCHFTDKSKADRLYIERIIPIAYWEKWNDLEFCLQMVKQNGEALKFVRKQTPEICLAAVQQYGNALKYVLYQNKELCLQSVRNFSCALRYVMDQDTDICLTACKQDGEALEFVERQNFEICLEAVRNCGCALKYVKKQNRELCLEAVRQCGCALEFVENQDLELCLIAIKQDPDYIEFVNEEFQSECINKI
jgi:hypothetical protein